MKFVFNNCKVKINHHHKNKTANFPIENLEKIKKELTQTIYNDVYKSVKKDLLKIIADLDEADKTNECVLNN